jgi:beta-lactamase regulating signal transducer with metallopeptidase domain
MDDLPESLSPINYNGVLWAALVIASLFVFFVLGDAFWQRRKKKLLNQTRSRTRKKARF